MHCLLQTFNLLSWQHFLVWFYQLLYRIHVWTANVLIVNNGISPCGALDRPLFRSTIRMHSSYMSATMNFPYMIDAGNSSFMWTLPKVIDNSHMAVPSKSCSCWLMTRLVCGSTIDHSSGLNVWPLCLRRYWSSSSASHSMLWCKCWNYRIQAAKSWCWEQHCVTYLLVAQ